MLVMIARRGLKIGPIEVFGIALYSPWTGKGYLVRTIRNDAELTPDIPGKYHDELVKLIAERKKRYHLP